VGPVGHRTRLLLAAVAVVLAVGAATVALARSGPTPVTVSAAPTSAPTTTTTVPSGVHPYRAAFARGPELGVLGEPPPGVKPEPTLFAPRPTRTSPIPRDGFAGVGVSTTPLGYTLSNPTYFGNPLALLVVQDQGDWLEVALPARPNQTSGWVRADDVVVVDLDARIELDLATTELVAWVGGEEILRTQTSIGSDANRTPEGTYYITDIIPRDRYRGALDPSIGEWAFGTSAYSEDLETFGCANCVPVIAIHTYLDPAAAGQRTTNGCVHLTGEQMALLAGALPPATPFVVKNTSPDPD